MNAEHQSPAVLGAALPPQGANKGGWMLLRLLIRHHLAISWDPWEKRRRPS